GPAALRAEVEGRGEGVRRDDADVRQIDPQLLRQHLGRASQRAAADLGRAGVQRDGAVRVDLHVHARGSARRRPPAAGEPLTAPALGPPLAPPDRHRCLAQALLEAAVAIGWSERRPERWRGKGLACGWWTTTG